MTGQEAIEAKISHLPYGKAFILSDFTDIASYDNIRQIFTRLEDSHTIRRILPGVYDRPQFSKLLNEYAAPEPDETAKAIARKHNWTITPSGNSALNLMGLSTQVPARWEYYSTGPNAEYQVENALITFTHRADKDLGGMSPTTALVIQALKVLGQDRITPEIRQKIAGRLSESDRKRLAKEARSATAWIYEEIKKINALEG